MVDAWNTHTLDTVAENGLNGLYCRVCRHEQENGRQEQEDIPMADKVSNAIQIPPENVILRASGGLDVVAIPYVLKYLCAELASMGIKMSFDVSDPR